MSTEHLSHGQMQNGRPVHPDVSFEKTDVRTSPILKFLVSLGILIILSYAIVYGIYSGLKGYWADSYSPPLPSSIWAAPTMPPEPCMQGMPAHLVDSQQDMRGKTNADIDANNQGGWVDQKAGIARIPVQDAMQLIVEKGLPAVTPPPAE